MKHSPKHMIAAAMLATLCLAAVAHTPPGPPPASPGRQQGIERVDPARMQEHMQARRAQRQARLKETLQVSQGQEGAWSTWTTAMQPPANWKRPDRSELARLPTPERIDRMRAIRTERIAVQDKRADATKAFYATLNPIQKRVFDQETARRGDRGGREGDHGGHRRHHWN